MFPTNGCLSWSVIKGSKMRPSYNLCLWMLSWCVPGHVYMDACDACVVYMCLSTCLSGIHAQPHCRLVAWGYNNLASVGLQDSATSDSSNGWFGPSGFKSSFNGACSSSWGAMALCCDVMCGNLVSVWTLKVTQTSPETPCLTELFFQHVLLQWLFLNLSWLFL